MTDEIPAWGTVPHRRLNARLDAMRRLSATDDVVNGLRRDLAARAVTGDTAEALVAGARALLPIASRAGVAMTVSVGPDHAWTVRVDGELAVVEPRRGAEPGPEPGSPPAVAAQLAQLLRDGQGHR
jgi:hypothetical protein